MDAKSTDELDVKRGGVPPLWRKLGVSKSKIFLQSGNNHIIVPVPDQAAVVSSKHRTSPVGATLSLKLEQVCIEALSNVLARHARYCTNSRESSKFLAHDSFTIGECVVGVVEAHTNKKLAGGACLGVAVASRNDRGVGGSESADVLKAGLQTGNFGDTADVEGFDVLESLGNSDQKLASPECESLATLLHNHNNASLTSLNTDDVRIEVDAIAKLASGSIVKATSIARLGNNKAVVGALHQPRPELLESVKSGNGGDVARVPVQLSDKRKDGTEVILLSELSKSCLENVVDDSRDTQTIKVLLHTWGIFEHNDANIGWNLSLRVDIRLGVASDLRLLLNHSDLCACILEIDRCMDA
ncbi:hypothetical protein HG530_010785 [Fusarium avenaceum]|nr:hypothetical protein HG530_010785 [Fusarium avenaceum]